MPIPTPFHSRSSAYSLSHEWSNWSGYLSAVTYEAHHEREYFAIRNSAGLIDVTPLYKYEVTGPDATRVVDRIMTRDITKCKVGQVMYSPWCDEDGYVIDDGTISRLADSHYRITAADPSLRWFQDCGFGLDAEIVDVSESLAALALQGPQSRNILNQIDLVHNINKLKYYHVMQTFSNGIPLTITRTGFTGDLGYELWVDPQHAESLWDSLIEVGNNYGLLPCGLAALDIARIEAGLLLIDVDYISSQKAVIAEQKSYPEDIGLRWAVKFGKHDFIGRRKLEELGPDNSKWQFVGIEIDWDDLEKVYGEMNLPPQVSGRAVRDPVPIYRKKTQIGQATSITFSPILKKYIALGTILRKHASFGSKINVEITVEYSRKMAAAKIVSPRFFNPTRKKALVE
ncbi:MAG: aminomethyl transferase family protein [Chloroflexi bacterium]|nr:aminomethyl transferase family protein [Chloroflexota bacterium]